MTLLVLLGIFAVLAFIGVPLAFALGLATVSVIVGLGNVPLTIVLERLILGTDNFILVAIPLFILAANIMNHAGVTNRIFAFAESLVGHFPGALAHANIVSSVIFSGMSGSAVADCAALGKIEMKAMVDQGYPKKFAAGVTCASATIGPIFPPSIPMVIYGGISGVSVGKLFVGGVIPGLIIAVALMVYVHFTALRHSYPRSQGFSWRHLIREFQGAFLPVMTPVVIVGGILFGYFTPTEAAAFTVLYALILGFCVYGELRASMLPGILLETFVTSAIILFIISMASAFSWVLTVNRFGDFVIGVTRSLGSADNPLLFLGVLNLAILALGMVMETTAILIIMTPILVPVVHAMGIDLVHFGVMFVLNLMIGLSTPPFGLALFTVAQVAGLSIEEMMRAIWPFVPPLLVVLILVIFIPGLTTWLPRLLLP